VLGGGGVRGTSWLMGALHGLVAETGWDPADSELVVGTSAGAVVAALTASGAKPWDALAPDRQDLLRALMEGATFRVELRLRSLAPGSLPLVGRALRAGPAHVMKVLAGVLPEGFVSTDPIIRLMREQGPESWPVHQRLWVVATDYATGERVAFGRTGSPSAELAVAVAASCAISGFYRPAEVGGGGTSTAACTAAPTWTWLQVSRSTSSSASTRSLLLPAPHPACPGRFARCFTSSSSPRCAPWRGPASGWS
jgi:NTE family protein